MLRRKLFTLAMASLVLGASLAVAQPTGAQAATNGCSSWSFVSNESHPWGDPWLTAGYFDRNGHLIVGATMQRQKCVFGDDIVWRVRAVAQSGVADVGGKSYEAVALYRGPAVNGVGKERLGSWVSTNNDRWKIPVGATVTYPSFTASGSYCYEVHIHVRWGSRDGGIRSSLCVKVAP